VKKPVEIYCGKRSQPPRESQSQEAKDPESSSAKLTEYSHKNILLGIEFRTELMHRKAAQLLEHSTNYKLAALLDALSEFDHALQELCAIIEEMRIMVTLQKTVFRPETNNFYMVFKSTYNPRILHVFSLDLISSRIQLNAFSNSSLVSYFLVDNLSGETSSKHERKSTDFLVNNPAVPENTVKTIFPSAKLEEYHKVIATTYNTKLNGRIIRPGLRAFITFANSWEVAFKQRKEIGSTAVPFAVYHENIVLNAN